MIKFSKKIDMVPGTPPAIIHLNQYDDDVVLEFELFASSGEFTVESDTEAGIRGTKPDGNGISMEATLTSETDSQTNVTTNYVTVAVTKQMTAVAGPAQYELTLTKNEKELNTANFTIIVERAALDMDTPHSGSVLREFVAVNDNYQDIVDAAAAANAAKEDAVQANADAQTAKEAAEGSASDAAGSAQDASDALTVVNNAKQSAIDQIDEKAAQIARLTTNAAMIAANAAQRVNDIENQYSNAEARIQALEQRIVLLVQDAENHVADGYVENEVAIFENSSGDRLFTITGIGGGSGGGGGGGDTVSSVMTFENVSGWRSKNVATGKPCPFTFGWTSMDGEIETGPGVLQVVVDGNTRTSQEVQQGNVTIDLAPYVNVGTNSVTIKITDADGNMRRANLTVTVAEITISSTYDASVPVEGPFTFSSTPTGANLQKTYYYIVDGVTIGTAVTSVSDRQVSYMIPAQSHGGHSLRVYFECVINNETVRSNELYYEFIAIEPLNDDKIIVSSFDQQTAQQYSVIPFSFTVYDPLNLETSVSLYANNVLLTTLTVDRTEQSYPYRADDNGTLNFRIQAGTESKTLTVTVEETEIDVQAETENLKLYLNAAGRANTEEHPEVWKSTAGGTTVSATLTDFNFASDGWGTDDDGNQRLRLTGDARAAIPFKPFENDPRPGGLTISVEFGTSDVIDYTAPIISCMDGGRGFQITPESAMLYSNESQMGSSFKEDVHLRVDFVISKRSNGRLLKVYTDGVQCGSAQYPDGDVFIQGTPAGITIGSNLCTVDIYNIRIYDNDLSGDQIVDNWIADTQDGALMLERYTRNNVYMAGQISVSKLPADLPYMIIRCAELPQYKGDKKTATLTFIDPVHPARSFISKVQLDVQGTSSQYYPRKNYKSKSKEGFESISTGTVSSKYAMNDTAIPAKTFTFKKDFASSEGANNTVLAMLFNEANPYRTAAQIENNKVRQSIQGFPMVVFWDNGTTTTFVGKYNFNDDKSSEEVFGFANGDEVWEVSNNTSLRCLCKKAGFSEMGVDEKGNVVPDWYNDFEARYPDTDPEYRDGAQLEAFLEWIASTDSTAATNDLLDEPVTYTTIVTTYVPVTDPVSGAVNYIEAHTTQDVTFTNDTAEYRVAKFKDEAPGFIEMVSLHFYANFCELFLGADSLAKNNMFGFIGATINAGEEEGE